MNNTFENKCPCLSINEYCTPCDKGYHCFCNQIPHGDISEAYDYFMKHPEIARSVVPLSDAGKELHKQILADLAKKEIKQ